MVNSYYPDYSSRPAKIARTDAQAPKKPLIVNDHLYIGDKSYAIQRVGRGNNHRVFQFIEQGELNLEGTICSLQDVVVRTFSILKNGPQIAKIVKGDRQGYQYLREQGYPTPQVYLHPDHFSDPVNPKNGEFWIIEKLERKVSVEGWSGNTKRFEELSQEDQKALTFAKAILTKSFSQEQEAVDDFRVENVMWKGGELYICDFGEMQHEDRNDFYLHMRSCIKSWSAGNPFIKDFLLADVAPAKRHRFEELEKENRDRAVTFMNNLPKPVFN